MTDVANRNTALCLCCPLVYNLVPECGGTRSPPHLSGDKMRIWDIEWLEMKCFHMKITVEGIAKNKIFLYCEVHSTLNPKFTLIHGQSKYMCNKCLNKILRQSSKSPGTTISMDVTDFQVSWTRFPETYFGRKLLDENLRTQLLLLPAQLLAFAYAPMNHRRLTNVGFVANDPQTDCWQFCSYKAEGTSCGDTIKIIII